jgi:hypothetical protein
MVQKTSLIPTQTTPVNTKKAPGAANLGVPFLPTLQITVFFFPITFFWRVWD